MFESGSHHADVGYTVVSSHSVKQSSLFAQSHVDLLDEKVLTVAQSTLNSVYPFSEKSDNAQSEQSGAFMLNASASLDNSVSMSKLSHDPILTQERGLSFDRVPAVFSDDVVEPNLPVSGSFSSSLKESSTDGNQLQLHNVLSKQRDSSKKCNERTRTEREVRENVRDDIDADTEYSSLQHLTLRLSFSSEDDEELGQDIVKSSPSALVRSSERSKNMHEEVAKPAEMDKADLSDDIADESIRMKTLRTKGSGETIDGASTIQHSGNDAITSNVATKL